MKKKYLLGLLIVVSLFIVTACGSKTEEDNEENTNNINNVEDSENEEYEDIELYSDDTKLVFARGDGKVVFYYSGNEITGETAYFNYQTNAAAKIALDVLNNDKDDNIDKAYVQGKYLVVEYNENEYGTLTLEDVKLTYSYIEELQKGN